MLFAIIWKTGKGPLIVMERDRTSAKRGYTAQSYIKALQEGFFPIYNDWKHFQQDNASIHIAEVTMDLLLARGVSLIDWPPHSPDLNPIEHVWAALKRNLRRMFPDLWTLKRNELDIEYFKHCVRKAWEAIPDSLITKLMDSMGRRLKAVKKARGGYTKY